MSLVLLLLACRAELPTERVPLASETQTTDTDTGGETGSVPPTGHTGPTSVVTGDTSVVPVECAAAVLDQGLDLATIPPMDTFELHGSVARWPTGPGIAAFGPAPGAPGTYDTSTYEGMGAQLLHHTWNGAGLESDDVVRGPAFSKLLVSGTRDGVGYLATHAAGDELYVWNTEGNYIFGGDVSDCVIGSAQATDFDIAIGRLVDQQQTDLAVLAGCRETGGQTSLRQVTAKSVADAVVFPAMTSGDIAGHPRTLAFRPDGSLWVGDDGDDQDPGDHQAAWLLPTTIESSISMGVTNPLLRIDGGAKFDDPLAPAMRLQVADVDDNDQDDVAVNFTAAGPDQRGELWILSNPPRSGAELGRDDMTWVISPPEGSYFPGPFTVLEDADGGAHVVVSIASGRWSPLPTGDRGGSTTTADTATTPTPTGPTGFAWIDLPAATVTPVEVPIDAEVHRIRGLGLKGVWSDPYDLVSTGDIDGDGCDDLLVHVLDLYAPVAGQGRAYIYSGR